jgi:hypothetical protein
VRVELIHRYLCWIQQIIKLTYRLDEESKKSIDKGAFTLGRDGTDFLPEHWNAVLRIWQCVESRLDSQKDDQSDPFFESDGVGLTNRFGGVTESHGTKSGAQAATDMTPTRYRVDFFYRSKYSHEHNFLESKS